MGTIQRQHEETTWESDTVTQMTATIPLEEFHATGEGEVKGSLETFGHTTDAGEETVTGNVVWLQNQETGETFEQEEAMRKASELDDAPRTVLSDQLDINQFEWTIEAPDGTRTTWEAHYNLNL